MLLRGAQVVEPKKAIVDADVQKAEAAAAAANAIKTECESALSGAPWILLGFCWLLTACLGSKAVFWLLRHACSFMPPYLVTTRTTA